MDKRHFLENRVYQLSDGSSFSVNVYEKHVNRGITIRMVYGEMEAYVSRYTTKKQLDDFVKKVYAKSGNKIVTRPFYKENLYIYLLGRKRYLTNDPQLKENENYFYVPSTCKDPLVRYKKLFLEYLSQRVVEIGEKMGKDLSGYKIRTGLFLTYYGCCFPTKKQLKFDYRLFAYKQEISDCILVHEIAHTYEVHHNERFYRIVKMYCPDYDKLENEIKTGRFEGEMDNYVF